MNLFWRVFLLIKRCFFVKIAENLIFRHSLLIVFFLGMFCKLQSQVTEISNRGTWSKCLKPPNIYGTHWHSVTKRVFFLSKIPPCKNRIWQHTLLAFWSTTNTLLMEPTYTIRHRQESNRNITLECRKLDFKIPGPWV